MKALGRSASMFTINWVERGHESEPIVTEASGVTNISQLVAACKQDLYRMRVLYTDMPPDGFILIDHEGREAQRRFRAPPPIV
jgi:hypothetical protein